MPISRLNLFVHRWSSGITWLETSHVFKMIIFLQLPSKASSASCQLLHPSTLARAHTSASCLPPGHPTPSPYLRQHAKDILGLRESWNTHSNWGLQALALHLLNVHVDKDLQVCDWEGDLTDEHMAYAAIDVILPHLLQHCLFRLKAKGCKRGSRVLTWAFGALSPSPLTPRPPTPPLFHSPPAPSPLTHTLPSDRNLGLITAAGVQGAAPLGVILSMHLTQFSYAHNSVTSTSCRRPRRRRRRGRIRHVLS